MPQWKRVLKLGDLHEKYKRKAITVQELANGFADRLELLPYKEDPIIEMAVSLLREVEDIEQYDEVLSIVYEFGDINHRLWVDTTSKAENDDEKRAQDATAEAAR